MNGGVWTGRFLLAVGGALMIVTLVGSLTQLGKYPSFPEIGWDRLDPSLVASTRGIDDLGSKAAQRFLPSMSSRDKMTIIFDVVAQRFTHGDKSSYNIYSNWLLYLMGIAHPNFSMIYDPEIILRNGHSAMCGGQSYVLLVLAEHFGIRSRHVGLYDHVVMEAWYDNNWHMYDPDLEVVPDVPGRGVLSVEDLALDTGLISKFYQARGSADQVREIVRIIASREDNTFMSYPRLAQFEWKSNVLLHFERLANWLKWLIPGALIVAGIGLMLNWRR